ncbi:cytochrome P450 [Murinocardiopsis flavida]|uniref:Cytochrome P450 n=1 Tax=Murinocardiopsis flavida TaxID=645275 RepID=A0A2P8DU37_9ACTN|nr:cytochrome P450 [Murinocardiopsis flavida]PSL00729.1 cytochrome P450 [Murinocardiopsis flavida]
MPEPARPAALADIDLSDLRFWSGPPGERHEAFARLRAHPPVYFAEPDLAPIPRGPGYHALVRHSDVVAASRLPSVFASEPSAISIPDMPREFNEFFGSMINLDDPRHARVRRVVSRGFTPRMLAKIDGDIARIAARIAAELPAKGDCDFVAEVAAPLPLAVICDMMGIPESRRAMVRENTAIVLAGADAEFLGGDGDAAAHRLLTAGGELAGLLGELAAERRRTPVDDLTSALVNADIDGEALSDQEIGSFFILLAVAGSETTRNAISHGLALLTDHPDQRALWWADFEAHAATAVEEIVRHASPVTWMRRTLTRDHELNGHHYAAGDKALLFYASANRDEAVFTDPDRFDVTRSPNPHVGFGGPGPHYCLGAHLARREITAMFRELHRSAPGIRATGEPRRLVSDFLNGIKTLPCAA